MRICGIFLVLAFFAMVHSVDFPKEDEVLVLTDETFSSAIQHYQYILVEFYAPWCGHCKKLAPEYAKAAQALAKETPPIPLAKVDATVNKELASKYEVQGFPTLKLFVNGVPQEYQGGRTEAEIISWLKKKTGPVTTTLGTVDEVEAFYKKQDVAVVYFGSNPSNIEVFQNVARSSDDLLFGTCSSADAYAHYKVQEDTVVLFKNFDDKRNDYTEKLTVDGLRSFISQHSSPMVMKFDEKCAQLIFGKNIPGLFLYRDKNSESSKELDILFGKIAEKVKGKIQVIITDITEGLETRLAEYIGVTAQDLPTVRIHDTRVDLKKYNMVGDITEENVMKFIEDWEKGLLKPHLKSEEIPEKQEGDVYVLVGKAFEEVVLNSDKDVLLEFYAPWCGHCKKLAPIYEEVATKLKHNKQLLIAKMDATANEIEQVQIQGFPTLKFFPAGKKESPIDYDGERTVEGFIQFFEKHATHPIKPTKEDL